MPQAWRDYPFAVAYLLFLTVILLRGQATYWLARLVSGAALRGRLRPGTVRHRLARWLDSRVQGRGTDVLERYGLVVIPLAHLTVGVQTIVLAAAGLLRITWWRFALAQLVGGLAWAAIYTTIGFAVWWAAVTAAVGHWWLALLVVAVIVAVAMWRRHLTLRPFLDRAEGDPSVRAEQPVPR